MEQVKEQCRESRGTLWLASVAQDLRFGARILTRSPGFSATAIVVLALGIGVNTLAFSLYNLIALQLIPVHDPKSLVSFERRSPENITPAIPWQSIVYYRDNAKSLSALLPTMAGAPMVLDRDEQRVKPSFVAANYFSELGATATVGRLFDPVRENSATADPVAILSYSLWQRKYGADPSIIGKTIHLAGKSATVIGITPQSFANLGTNSPDVWLPLMQHTYFVDGSKQFNDPKFEEMITVTARLAPGVTIPQASQELLTLTTQLRKLYPALIWDKEYIRLLPGAHFVQLDDHAYPILALAGLLVLLILAVACANLGGLLMARGVSRQTRDPDSLLDRRPALAHLPPAINRKPAAGFAGIDYRAASKLCCASPRSQLCRRSGMDERRAGLAGAHLHCDHRSSGSSLLQPHAYPSDGEAYTRQNFGTALRDQRPGGCQLRTPHPRRVVGTRHPAYHLRRSRLRLHSGPLHRPGSCGTWLHAECRARLPRSISESPARLPGVTSVSMALLPPLVNHGVMITSIKVDGHTVMIYPNWVGPEFFQTMGIPLLRGRYLRQGDTNAVVLSESLARKRWPHDDPIGKQWQDGKDVVVGVVGNTRAMEMNNTDATEIYYPPTEKHLPGMFVLVKAGGESNGLFPAIKSISNNLDIRLFPTITPLQAGYRKNVAQVEQIAAIISLLGGIAIFLAVVGLLGLVGYAVSQRTKEIAIRMALGARRAEIFSTVLRRFTLEVLIGLVAGVAMTAAVSQVLRRFLYGISGLDPISYASSIALLIVILAAAAFVPVHRALRIDIARILHSE